GQKEGDLALVGAQLERDLDLDRPAVRRRLRPGFVAEGEDLVEDQPDGRQHEGAGDGEETWRHGAIFPRGSAPDPERKMQIRLKIRPACSPLDRASGGGFRPAGGRRSKTPRDAGAAEGSGCPVAGTAGAPSPPVRTYVAPGEKDEGWRIVGYVVVPPGMRGEGFRAPARRAPAAGGPPPDCDGGRRACGGWSGRARRGRPPPRG